jgi:hypothetical protein
VFLLYFGFVFCCISGTLQILIAVWAVPDITQVRGPWCQHPRLQVLARFHTNFHLGPRSRTKRGCEASPLWYQICSK